MWRASYSTTDPAQSPGEPLCSHPLYSHGIRGMSDTTVGMHLSAQTFPGAAHKGPSICHREVPTAESPSETLHPYRGIAHEYRGTSMISVRVDVTTAPCKKPIVGVMEDRSSFSAITNENFSARNLRSTLSTMHANSRQAEWTSHSQIESISL